MSGPTVNSLCTETDATLTKARAVEGSDPRYFPIFKRVTVMQEVARQQAAEVVAALTRLTAEVKALRAEQKVAQNKLAFPNRTWPFRQEDDSDPEALTERARRNDNPNWRDDPLEDTSAVRNAFPPRRD